MKRRETDGHGEDETTNEWLNSIVNQSALGKYDLIAIGENVNRCYINSFKHFPNFWKVLFVFKYKIIKVKHLELVW